MESRPAAQSQLHGNDQGFKNYFENYFWGLGCGWVGLGLITYFLDSGRRLLLFEGVAEPVDACVRAALLILN